MSLDLPIQDHLMKPNEVKAEFSDIGCGITLYVAPSGLRPPPPKGEAKIKGSPSGGAVDEVD